MTERVITIEGLTKRFGDFTALDGLDLNVSHGEVRGFLGPNGAGKSTTIKLMLGFQRADAGRIRVCGFDPVTHSARINRQTSYVPGDVSLWPMLTGRQVLDALAGLRGAYDQEAERGLVEDFGLDLRKRVRTYSKGNRQKVVLVAAFAARTQLLVLDEPTSGLDPLMEEVFQHHVRRAADEGRTVLLSSHILAEVEALCDSVTIIKDGRAIENGRLAKLRHLAASQITASVPDGAVSGLERRLREMRLLGVDVQTSGELRVSVGRDRVNDVLCELVECGAVDVTCTPASLEDLFLRHYDVGQR